MSAAFTIARNDLRVFLKNKAAYFWLFISPLMFAFFLGMANRGPGDPANTRPSLAIENLDEGFLGKIFVDELGSQGLRIVESGNRNERRIRIPKDFTASIRAAKPIKLQFERTDGSSTDLAFIAELRLFRALVAMNGHLIELAQAPSAITEEAFREVLRKTDPVGLAAIFATRKPIPAGYRQSVPGILVMFTMMNLLIFGGVTVASERREGVLRRLLAQPVSFHQLVSGKIMGLMLLGGVQMAVLLVVATLFMSLNVANNLLAIALTLAVYAWVAAALGVLIGSVVAREDKVVGICVLVSMVMAALGGCWWPLEIVPDNVRAAGLIMPTSWAMQALHQLISFGGGLSDVGKPLGVLLGFAVAASYGAVRFFRVA